VNNLKSACQYHNT